ncbi:MAG: DNA adenine methylase [Nitrospirae bacterium]|nr:DNA adenine methylase [Candidatus Manganitrophaceae bacterium]
MIRTTSPLRYPGGKSCLYGLVSTILRENRLERGHYVEPYAGGCGLALSLLYEGHVSDIHINDLDISICAFWECVLNRTEELIELVEDTPVTIKEWHRQKEIHLSVDSDNTLQLAFATFFLNRTNRSGVIKGAGAIGGLSQNSNYKLDCRFNRKDLARRIKRVAKYRNRIHLTNLDAIPFMKQMQKNLPEKTFFCIDPPYFNKGSSLYTNYYGPDEHKDVADTVLGLKYPWIVTYDYTKEIQALYVKRRQFLFDINYSIQTKRVGSELLIASKGLRLPDEIKNRQTNRPQYRKLRPTLHHMAVSS